MANLPSIPATIFRQSLSAGNEFNIRINTDVKPPVLRGKHTDDTVHELIDSVMSKLVYDPNVEIKKNTNTNEWEIEADSNLIQKTVDDTIASIQDAKNMLDALPDLALVKDIIISSILSPNDMMSTELIYTNDSTLFDDVESELTAIIKDYFDEDYKIKTFLHSYLERALFIEGAAPVAVIAESSIDHAINSNLKITQESIKAEYDNDSFKHYGFLGNPRYLSQASSKRKPTLSFESFSVSVIKYNEDVGSPLLGASVIDNPHALKLPMLNAKIRKDRIQEIYGTHSLGLENYHTTEANWLTNKEAYPTRESNIVNVLGIKSLEELEKPTVGHPVVFDFPTEAVIPVYSPADPSDHVCYFIALDEYGNPVRADQQDDQMARVNRNFQTSMNGQMSSQLIQTAERMGLNDGMKYNKEDMAEMAKLYSKVIEKDLIERLEAGGFEGKDLKLAEASEIYKLMFVRALAGMKTQLLFLPKDFLTYIAFDYKPNGVGLSILEKTKTVGSLRMVNTMADAIASAKSSIDHRKLEIKLDPDDPDPMKTIERYLHEFQRATKASFPMGVASYADIMDYLQKAGVQVNITGHEGVPDMNMEFSNHQYSYTKPDSDYAEKLAKKHTMALGAPPESITNIEDIQFATQIISGNVFFAKINLWRQMVFCEHLSDFMQKYTRNSQPLLDALTKIIEKNREALPKIDKKFDSKAAAIVFANNIRVELPKPDVAQIKMQSESFSEYMDFLDKAIPSFVGTELFTSDNLGDRSSEVIDQLTQVLKAHFSREWLINNNALPELFDLVNQTAEANDRFEFLMTHTKYLDHIAPVIKDYIIDNVQRAKHQDGVINKAEELVTGEEADEYSSDTDYSSDDSSTDDTGGEDDFGMDEEMEDTGEEGGEDDFGGEEDWDF